MKKILSLCVLGLVMASCSDSDDINPNTQVEIRLNSNVNVDTRYLQETQVAANQVLGLYVTATGETSTFYNNERIIANGNGGFSYPTTLYYPLGSNNNVDFYAINPYIETASLTAPLRFSVKTDQSEDGDYLDSDLLYASTTDVERTYDAVPLSFTHKLTKVTFVVKNSGLISLEELSDIEVQNVFTDVSINLLTGDLTEVSSTPTSVTVNNVEGTTENSRTNMAAIIVPQTFTAEEEKPFIQITIGENIFYYTPTTNINFESGKSYNYTITVYNTGIVVESDILEWDEQPNVDGSGTPGN